MYIRRLGIKWGLCKSEILKEEFKNLIEKTQGGSKEFLRKNACVLGKNRIVHRKNVTSDILAKPEISNLKGENYFK
jgi:hypothetical protein